MNADNDRFQSLADIAIVGNEGLMAEDNAALLSGASPTDAMWQLAERVACLTGCNPRREGNSWVVNCPCHEADGGQHNASLAIFIGRTGRIAFCCRAGCPPSEVAAALRRHGVERPGQVSDSDRLQAAVAAEQHAGRLLDLARRLWEDASPYGRYRAKSYLAARGLTLTPAEAGTFRDANERGRSRLLVAGIAAPATFSEGHVQWAGVQTLALTDSGTPLLDGGGRKIRRIYGKLATNGVLLGYPGERIVVGEGIESVLSAMRILVCDSGLASLSATNLPQIALPPNARYVEIAADHDDPGRHAADALLHRLLHSGLTAKIALPTSPGDDFNDVLMKRIQAARMVQPDSVMSGEARNCDEPSGPNESHPS